MKIQRHAAWLSEQESAARQMRLSVIRDQIRAGVYETPARISAMVDRLQEVLNGYETNSGMAPDGNRNIR